MKYQIRSLTPQAMDMEESGTEYREPLSNTYFEASLDPREKTTRTIVSGMVLERRAID